MVIGGDGTQWALVREKQVPGGVEEASGLLVMGLLTILKKMRQKERELRLLMLYPFAGGEDGLYQASRDKGGFYLLDVGADGCTKELGGGMYPVGLGCTNSSCGCSLWGWVVPRVRGKEVYLVGLGSGLYQVSWRGAVFCGFRDEVYQLSSGAVSSELRGCTKCCEGVMEEEGAALIRTGSFLFMG